MSAARERPTGGMRKPAACSVLMIFAAIASGCDERELLNESTAVPIEKHAQAPDAISVIVLRKGFLIGETAAVTANDALRALGTPTPDKVLVLRCEGADYEAISEMLRVLKERDIVAALSDANPPQCLMNGKR